MSIVRLTLIMLGLAILGLGATASFFALPPLMARIRAEERPLHTEFRGEYEAYCARTWRLLPGLFEPPPVLRESEQFWLKPPAPAPRYGTSRANFDVFWTVGPAGERLASVPPMGRCLECR